MINTFVTTSDKNLFENRKGTSTAVCSVRSTHQKVEETKIYRKEITEERNIKRKMAVSDEEYADDDYSQTTDSEYSFQNRMQNNYQSTMTKAELRRSTKPIMEKRRRARINRCLNELKSLILDAMKKDPARHSKLEKADILEMTVKHLQDVQKSQLSAAMIADPAVMRKFQGGFAECATEVSRYIDGLEGIDAGVRRRLASHLTSCVRNLPSSRNSEVNDPNNNPRLNAISASLHLIPRRLPNGELALLVPDAQSLPNNVLPFFQLADSAKMVPDLGHRRFCELNQVSTTTDKVADILRLDTSPSHPSAFTAVNKNSVNHTLSPSSVVSSVSSSADRNVVLQQHTHQMSSEVSSTSEHPAESSTDPSSSFNSSASSLSPPGPLQPSKTISSDSPQTLQNKSGFHAGVSPVSPQQYFQGRHLQLNPQNTGDKLSPLPHSSHFSPTSQTKQQWAAKNMNHQRDVGHDDLHKDIDLQRDIGHNLKNMDLQRDMGHNLKNIDLQRDIGHNLKNMDLQRGICQDFQKDIDHQRDIGHNLGKNMNHHRDAGHNLHKDIGYQREISQDLRKNLNHQKDMAHNLPSKQSFPKDVSTAVKYSNEYRNSFKTIDVGHALSKHLSTSVKYPQENSRCMDGFRTYEPFPPVPNSATREQHILRKRLLDGDLKMDATKEKFSLPLTVDTNLEGSQRVSQETDGEKPVESPRENCLPIDFSKNVVPTFQNMSSLEQQPSSKRRRLEGQNLPNFARSSESAVVKGDLQSFSPRIIQHEKGAVAADDVPSTARNQNSNSDAGGSDMWRPW